MKKILIVTAFVPNNKTAGQNYTYNLIDNLSERHNVSLCYFKYPEDSEYESKSESVKILRKITITKLSKLFNVLKIPFLHPFFTNRFSIKLAYYLYGIRNDYDLFYFDFSQVFLYSFFVRNKIKYLMAHDIITQVYSRKNRLINAISKQFCYSSEKFILKNSNAKILCFSKKDKGLIKHYFNLYSDKVDFFIDKRIKQIDYGKIKINRSFCFYGAWKRKENSNGLEWFIDSVIPLLDNKIRFLVIGSGLSEKLQKKIAKIPKIKILGFVDNPYTILTESIALIAPLFQGAGVKVKVIESLACGTPVIGTEIAFEGIDFIDNKYLKECAAPADYVKEINGLLNCDVDFKIKLKKIFSAKYPVHTFINIIK